MFADYLNTEFDILAVGHLHDGRKEKQERKQVTRWGMPMPILS